MASKLRYLVPMLLVPFVFLVVPVAFDCHCHCGVVLDVDVAP